MDVVLSDRMRRLLCRGAFVLLCLLPTVWTLWHIASPVTTTSRTAAMSLALGVPVQASSIRNPAPGNTVIENLVFDMGADAGQVAADRTVLENMAEGRVIRIRNLSATSAGLLGMLDRFERAGELSSTGDRPVVIHVENLTLVHPENPQREFVFRNAVLQFERATGKAKLQLIPDSANGSDVAIEAVRIVDQKQTSWLITSNGHFLPGWLFGGFVPGLKECGSEVRIAGAVELYQRESGWSGTLAGVTIDQLNLEDAVYRTFGQHLTGHAAVIIDSATFVDNRICEVSGRLAAVHGEIGTGLLNACTEFAGMISSFEIAEIPVNSVPYARLSFQFGLKGHRFRLSSLDSVDGSILFSEKGEKLLFVGNGQHKPMMSLFRILSWPADADSPITRRTQGLANRLAWPALTIPDLDRPPASERYADDPEIGGNIFLR